MPGQPRRPAEKTPPEPPPVVAPPVDEMHGHRVHRYMAMGFSEASAEALAAVKDGPIPLWPGKVEKALNHGASYEQAFAIFV